MLVRCWGAAVAADAVDIGALGGVVQIGEAGVVELEIGAAERRQAGDLLGVDLGEVVPERLHLGIGGLVDRRAAAAVMQHRRRGDRQLGRRAVGAWLPDRGFEKGEIVAENRLVEPKLAGDAMRGRAELDGAGLILEFDMQAVVAVGDAADLIEEIHVPRAAAHLAVGDPAEADVPLQLHPVANGAILGCAQLGRGEAASLMGGSGF